MMRVLLADDEPLALQRLHIALKAIPGVQLAGTASGGVEASERIAVLKPDLVILDIQMQGRSGLEVAQGLPGGETSWRPEVVFVSAYDRFATDAFDIEAVDYLLKPVCFDRLRVAIERVRRRLALRAETADAPVEHVGATYEAGLWAPDRNGAVRIPIETIDWIEAARDYVLLSTASKRHMVRVTMNELEERLDPRCIVRIHRSHMVRLGAVVGAEYPGRGTLRLRLVDGANLKVGPRYQDRVVRALGL